MDEWRKRLATKLLGDRGTPTLELDARTTLEIALGRARSEVTYVLELGRSHALPMGGSVTGDDVWLRLGEALLRFRIDRQAMAITASLPGRKEHRFTFDAERHILVDEQQNPVNFEVFVRQSVESIVHGWEQGMRPQSETLPDVPEKQVEHTDAQAAEEPSDPPPARYEAAPGPADK